MMIVNSNILTGRPLARVGLLKARKISTSAPVKTTPTHSGNVGKRRHNPIAEPRSSAKSVLTMAISESTYKGYRTRRRTRRGCFGWSCRSNRQWDAKSEEFQFNFKAWHPIRGSALPSPVTQPSLHASVFTSCVIMARNTAPVYIPGGLWHQGQPSIQQKA